MHGQPLPDGIYLVDINLSAGQEVKELILKQVDGDHERTIINKKSGDNFSAEMDISNGNLMKISGVKGLALEGIELTKKQ